MGDYNADPVPNHAQANMLISNLGFVTDRPLYFDQWTIDVTNRVDSFHDGTGRVKIHILFDQTVTPP